MEQRLTEHVADESKSVTITLSQGQITEKSTSFSEKFLNYVNLQNKDEWKSGGAGTNRANKQMSQSQIHYSHNYSELGSNNRGEQTRY